METLHTWDTEYSADSVEWCPVPPYHHVFVCGTYQLTEGSEQHQNSASPDDAAEEQTDSSKMQKKLGRLYLFNIDSSANLVHLQTIDMPAVLDTKWCHQKIKDKVLLGVAIAKGDLLVYELQAEKNLDGGDKNEECYNYTLFLITKLNICKDEEEAALALSLDWSTGRYDETVGAEPSIVVSDSRGGVSLLRLTDASLQLVQYWKAHEFEAWITAFNYWNTSIIYSGGDDCKCYVFDTRAGTDSPIATNRAHEMGVTSLHCNAAQENLLISGSYDEKLRIWDTRSMRHPLNTTALIGGIWRLKWDPQRWQHILAACMYGGFCVANCPSSSLSPSIVAEYKEHDSLAYGSDWCHLLDTEVKTVLQGKATSLKGSDDDVAIIATCSFYDHKLCVSVLNKTSLNEPKVQ